MKTVKYWVTGTRLPNFTAVGTPAELLEWLLGFPQQKTIAPLAVWNDVFRKGFRSCGYNGDAHWEPFELTPTEYDEFVAHLLKDESAGYRVVETPVWVQNELDWRAFLAEKEFGVPVAPYRKLLYRFDALLVELEAARAKGRRAAALVSNRLMRTSRRMQRLIAKYAAPPSDGE